MPIPVTRSGRQHARSLAGKARLPEPSPSRLTNRLRKSNHCGYSGLVTDLADAFPPETLRQYALVADGERGALIGPRGDIAFLCFPRWHDPAIFSSLIGGVGHYAVTPIDPRYVWGGHYEPGSLVWRSRWVTGDAVMECREALALPAGHDRLVLLRRIEALQGHARVRVVLDPRPVFGHD